MTKVKIIDEIKEREFRKYLRTPRIKNLIKRGRLTEETTRKQFDWVCKGTTDLMEEAVKKATAENKQYKKLYEDVKRQCDSFIEKCKGLEEQNSILLEKLKLPKDLKIIRLKKKHSIKKHKF